MSEEQSQAADELNGRPDETDSFNSFYRDAWRDMYMAIEHLHGDSAHEHFHDGMLDAVKSAEANGASTTLLSNNIRNFKVEICEAYARDKCRLENELEQEGE